MKLNILLNRIYLIYYKRKNKKNGVAFAKSCKISSNDRFEGNNYIAGSVIDSEVGYGSYVSVDCYFKKAKIGRFCSIASGAKIVGGAAPD